MLSSDWSSDVCPSDLRPGLVGDLLDVERGDDGIAGDHDRGRHGNAPRDDPLPLHAETPLKRTSAWLSSEKWPMTQCAPAVCQWASSWLPQFTPIDRQPAARAPSMAEVVSPTTTVIKSKSG